AAVVEAQEIVELDGSVRAARGGDGLAHEIDVSRAVRVVTLHARQRRTAGRVGLWFRMTGLAGFDRTVARSRGGAHLCVTRRARLVRVSARHREPGRLVLVAEHAVALGRDGRERRRVIVAECAVRAEVGFTMAAPGIEVGLPVTDLAHAAAGVARARQTA